MDIERFDLVDCHNVDGESWSEMKQKPQGEYIRYSDIEYLIQDRDDALAKLAAMENQKPVAYRYRYEVGGASQKGFKYKEEPSLIGLPEEPLYAKPVPADKSEVAVPGTDKLMPEKITEEMARAFWEEYVKDRDDLLVRCYKALYDAAPSHSQQVASLKRDIDYLRDMVSELGEQIE